MIFCASFCTAYGLCLVFGGEPEAYVFSAIGLGADANFLRPKLCLSCHGEFAGEPKLTLPLINKIAPGVAVIVAYLLLAEDVGFYLSARWRFLPCLFYTAKNGACCLRRL